MSCLFGENLRAISLACSRNQQNSIQIVFFSMKDVRLCSVDLCLHCQVCLNATESAECLVFNHKSTKRGTEEQGNYFPLLHSAGSLVLML